MRSDFSWNGEAAVHFADAGSSGRGRFKHDNDKLFSGLYMYVWSSHIARVWINRVRLPILLVVSWTGKNNIPLSPCVPENLVSRDGFSRPVPRQPAHLSILRLNLVLTYGIPPEFPGVWIAKVGNCLKSSGTWGDGDRSIGPSGVSAFSY